MPSCVVKSCKNNTTLQKKCQGVTFHRFPTGNEPWKNDWIGIIRNCRGQEDWVSSKSSVVCSIHFDQNDLYTTSKGRRRVVTYAVPKLLLFEPPVQEEQPEVKPETTSSLRVVSSDHVREQQSSLGSDQAPPPPITLRIGSEQPSGSCTPLSSAQNPPQTTIGLDAVDCDQPLLWDSPGKLRLMKIINKKNKLIEIHRKKIKFLNQKVRRLRYRNQTLKDIFKKKPE